jgi:uncharacterized protein YecT (DUF1311 family)
MSGKSFGAMSGCLGAASYALTAIGCLGMTGAAMAMPADVGDLCAGAETNLEYKVCLAKRYEVADRELNRIYKDVRWQVKGEQRTLLIDAQVAWIQYRDKTCDFETFASRQGSGYSGFMSACLERMTKARSEELQTYFKNR